LETVAVIILNWNGLADTIECVESVLEQSYTEYKIFLIDNGSDNSEFDALVQKFGHNAQIELIKNQNNLGFGPAHNNLFRHLIEAGYNNAALINNDAVAHSAWIEEALSAMQQNSADVIACKMLQYNNRQLIDSAGLKMLNTGEILPRGHSRHEKHYSKAKTVSSFCAGGCLLKLSIIERVGGFDTYFDTGYEDAELGLRVFVSGLKIVYAPQSILYHKMGQSLAKVKSYERTLKIMRDVNYTVLKNMPLSVLQINFPFYLLRSVFILLLFIISLRPKFVLVFFHSLFYTLFRDFQSIIKQRRLVLRKITFFEILKGQQFFIIYDFTRFVKYIIKWKPHKFEQ
jgi:GT2 family glycosyltransferase